jgi:hypothetical protein
MRMSESVYSRRANLDDTHAGAAAAQRVVRTRLCWPLFTISPDSPD